MARECKPEPGKTLWCQGFSLPAGLALFDARPLAIDSFAAGVFTVVEQQLDGSHLALGARVGELVAERFDGMIVPSVRGGVAEYDNIVVFRPNEPANRWHEFVDPREAPRELK